MPRLPENSELGEDGTSTTSPESPSMGLTLASTLKGSGQAFVVLKQNEDVETLFALWDQASQLQRSDSFHVQFALGELRRPTLRAPTSGVQALPRTERMFKGHELQLQEVTSEPTSIMWEHLGTPKKVVFLRCVVALLVFLVLLSAFNSFVLVVATNYVNEFTQRAGQAPKAWQTGLLSVVVGAGNAFIAQYIWVVAPRLGFERKDQEDIFVFVTRSLFVISYTFATVVQTSQKLAAVSKQEQGIIMGAGVALGRSEELGLEVAIGDAVFQMFLTTNFILSLVTSILPYVFNYFASVLMIRTGVLGSVLSVRQCEKLLEPAEFWLPWDYATHIQLPCCVFFPLILAEPPGKCAARDLSRTMLAWCAVWYCVQRVIHLRFSKETPFATNRLDTTVLYFWGLPISLLAVIAARWAARATGKHVVSEGVLCAAAFFVSVGLYGLLLGLILRRCTRNAPIPRHKEMSYGAALASLRYSYFNTNPGYVLVSDLVLSLGLPLTSWYEAGKAYLQTVDPKVDAQLDASFFVAEHGVANDSSRPVFSRLLHRARVWLTGVSEHEYSSLEAMASAGRETTGQNRLGRW